MSVGGNSRSSSNLAKIFSTAQPSPKNPLTYQAPTQPSARKESPSATKVVHAVTGVAAFRLNKEKNEYETQGKVGVAILRDLNSFQLLVYKTKDNHLFSLVLSSNFTFSTNASYMYINEKQTSWSLKFSTEDVCNTYSMHLTIVKYILEGGNNVIIQDLTQGTGKSIDKADEVKIKYSGYLVSEDKLGAQFDTNFDKEKALMFAVGAGKVVKGMDDGVVGMKKKGKRIVVIPAKFGYGDKSMGDKIPPNSTLVFLIQVENIRSKEPVVAAPVEPEPEKEDEASKKKEEVLNRVRNIGVAAMEGAADDHTAPNQGYGGFPQGHPGHFPGQPGPYGAFPPPNPYNPYAPPGYSPYGGMFPPQNPYGYPAPAYGAPAYPAPAPAPAPVVDQQLALVSSSASTIAQQQLEEEKKKLEEEKAKLKATKQALKEKKKQQKQEAKLQQQQLQQQQLLQQQQMQLQPIQSQLPQQYQTLQQQQEQSRAPTANAPGAPAPVVEGVQTISLAANRKFIEETKMLHEDIKTAVFGASSKLQQLHTEVQSSIFGSKGKGVAHGLVLVQTIQKYLEENERLQHEVNQKAERIDQLREKQTELLDKNKELMEKQTRTMEERNNNLSTFSDAHRKQITQLRDDKEHLEEEISRVTEALHRERKTLGELNLKNQELTASVETAANELQAARNELNEIESDSVSEESKLGELRAQLKDELAQRRTLQSQINSMTEQIDESISELKKQKSVFEARKKQWIQVKAQIEQKHEEEKVAIVRRVKQQLSKFKKEKDAAILRTEEVEKQTDAKWQQDVEQLKEQFSQRFEQLKEQLKTETEEDVQQVQERHKNKLETIHQRAQLVHEQSLVAGQANAKALLRASQSQSVDDQAHVLIGTKRIEDARNRCKSFIQSSLKKTMNDFYFALRNAIQHDEFYQSSDFIQLLVSTIRQSTFDSLHQMEEQFDLHVAPQTDVDENGEQIEGDTLSAEALGLNENQMLFDIEQLFSQFQLTENDIFAKPPPSAPEPDDDGEVEEQPEEEEPEQEEEEEEYEEVEEEVEEEAEPEPEPEPEPEVVVVAPVKPVVVEPVVEPVRATPVKPTIAAADLFEVVTIPTSIIEPATVITTPLDEPAVEGQVEEEEEEYEEVEEEVEEYEEVEVEVEEEVEEEDEELENTLEVEEVKQPEPEPEKPKPKPLSSTVNIFGDDFDDPLFSSFSSNKKTEKKVDLNIDPKPKNDDILSKFSTTTKKSSASDFDLFGGDDGGDLFGGSKPISIRGRETKGLFGTPSDSSFKI